MVFVSSTTLSITHISISVTRMILTATLALYLVVQVNGVIDVHRPIEVCGLRSVRNLREVPKEVTTPYFVRTRDKYPLEEHFVTTKDGYILGLHRIPYSRKLDNKNVTKKPVAFLQHCLGCSSSDYVINGPGKGLGYLLSDNGYDVWMGNSRGNTYSRNHTTISPESMEFWLFDWHDLGLYDMPPMIKTVLKISGQKKLSYIGHSQGGTVFLVVASLIPSIGKRIKSAHLLAPGCIWTNVYNPYFKRVAPYVGRPNPRGDTFSFEIARNTRFNCIFGQAFCQENSSTINICSNFLFLIAGYNPENIDKKILDKVLSTMPAGMSWRQFTHYAQLINSHEFRPMDFGPAKNILKYGSLEPPNYPLEKINVPTFFYASQNDWLVNSTDVKTCANKLNKDFLPEPVFKVPFKKFNHFDFLWGRNAYEAVLEKVLKDVKRFV